VGDDSDVHGQVEELGISVLHLELAQQHPDDFGGRRVSADAQSFVLDVGAQTLGENLDGSSLDLALVAQVAEAGDAGGAGDQRQGLIRRRRRRRGVGQHGVGGAAGIAELTVQSQETRRSGNVQRRVVVAAAAAVAAGVADDAGVQALSGLLTDHSAATAVVHHNVPPGPPSLVHGCRCAMLQHFSTVLVFVVSLWWLTHFKVSF